MKAQRASVSDRVGGFAGVKPAGWFLMALSVLMVFLGAWPVLAQKPGSSVIIERVLVRVNGEIFTQSELTQRQTDAVRSRQDQPRTVPEAELFKLLQEMTPDILVETVDELLIVQHGRELGFTFSDDEFKKGLDTLKKDNNLDDAGLKQALQQEGLTLDELRRNFERAWLRQMVQAREIFPRMRITEEEQRQYFAGNRSSFMTPETVTLREIAVIAPALGAQDPMSAATSAALKARIEAVRQRAVAGEDFAALVKEVSDSSTKASGGLIGPINARDLNPKTKALLDSLKPGEISEPIPLARGFQILKLETREEAVQQPFDKVRDQIEIAIRNERLDGEMTKLRLRLRTGAVIEWKDDNLRRIYEKRVGERLAATPPTQ
jgi:parvulin-like peptidyl-prolyl isomerase